MEKYDNDSDGVAVYWDKYIDVIATPQGDIRVDDRDEPDEAASSIRYTAGSSKSPDGQAE